MTGRKPGFAVVTCVVLAAVAALLVHVLLDVVPPRGFRLNAPLELGVVLIVLLPTLAAAAMASIAGHELGRRYELVPPDLRSAPRPDALVWERVTEAVRHCWDYEQERYRMSLGRIEPAALMFGLVASLLLAATVLFVAWRTEGHLVTEVRWDVAVAFAVSVGVATMAGFAINAVRLLVRIASLDHNARMFTWATRSIVLSVVADVGLFIAFQKASGAGNTATIPGAALLGVLSAGLGDRAIDLLFDKIAPAFGAKVPKASESPLLAVAGVTAGDVERFEEEGIVSLHDLAFTPTAQLFFNTTHSLQRIVDWQDQALLQVYFGKDRARRLAEAMTIRGVVDLQGLVETIRGDHDSISDVPASANGNGAVALLEEVKAVLQVTSTQGAKEALATVERDEPTMRLRLLFRSTVLVNGAPSTGDERQPAAPVPPTPEAAPLLPH